MLTARPAEDECFHWHRGWEAMGLAPPWFKADSAAALSNASRLAGLRRLCSSGAAEHGGGQHMAAAGDCCMPHFDKTASGGLAGRMMWTNIVLHMLTDPIDAPSPPAAAALSAGNCSCATA